MNEFAFLTKQRIEVSFARSRLLPLAVFVAAIGLYVATMAPGLLWGGGDFARFQMWAYLGEIDTAVDIFSHPLWVYLAHPFTWLPIRDPAWRANFASAVFASLALVFVFLSARRVTRSLPAALLGVAALAVSHTFWTYAVMPKVYSLNALLLAVPVYLLLLWRDERRPIYLALAAFLSGLSLLNHLVMAVTAAGFAAFVAVVLRQQYRVGEMVRTLGLACVFFFIGLAPYLYLMAQGDTTGETGGTIIGFLKGLLYALTQPDAIARGIFWGVSLGGYQFPLTWVVACAGLVHLWRRDRALALLIVFGVLGTVAFLLAALDPRAGSVYVWNLHYYLQAYVLVALAIAAGFDMLWPRWFAGNTTRVLAGSAATVAVPIILYAVAPRVLPLVWQDVPDFRPLPGRNNFTYVLSPWKYDETGARELGEAMLDALPPDSIIVADYSLWAVIRYLQVVEAARPDVELVLLEAGLEHQPAQLLRYKDHPNLFLADTYRYYAVEQIQEHFEIVPVGPVYRLIPRDRAS